MAKTAPDRDEQGTPGPRPGADGARARKLREINLILADSTRLSVTRKTQDRVLAAEQDGAPTPKTSAPPSKTPQAAGGPEFTFLQLADFKRLDGPSAAHGIPAGPATPQPPAVAPHATRSAPDDAGGLAADLNGVPSTAGLSGPFVAKSVAIGRLHSSRLRARRPYETSAINALATSLDRGRWRQPILVRPHPLIADDYEVVVGELPFQAARAGGLDCLPVVVCRLSDHRALECVLLEDAQRSDLAPLDVAIGYGQLIRSFDYRLADLARLTGRSERQVAEVLLLLDPPKASTPGPDGSRPGAGHAALAAAGAKPSLRAELAALERHLSKSLGLKVEMSARGPCGAVQISFADLEQLEWIARRLSSLRSGPGGGSRRPVLAA